METRSVWLVRHGQASFGKSDYDNLSETGHEQAYLLGKHFAAHGVAPSLIVSGSMKRHRQTLAEIADDATASSVRVLYGGSVNAKNVGDIVGQTDVDGALVGGASLKSDEFATLSAIAAGGPLP